MRSGVRLEVEGRLPERFLERLLAEGGRVRRCERLDERHMALELPLKSAMLAEALADRFGIRCRRLELRGVDALIWRLRGRRTVLAGAIAMCAVCALLCSRIWFVRVQSVDGAGEQVVAKAERALAELGVRPGMAAWGLDRPALRAQLVERVPEAGYVSVRVQGVQLTAEVSEAVLPPETYALSDVRNVVSMYDAVVERVDVYAGEAEVQPGDTVRRGQVLIRGQEPVSAEELRGVAADGAVMARTWLTAQAEQPVAEEIEAPTGRVRVEENWAALRWRWQVNAVQPFACERTRQEFLPVGGVFIPLGIARTVHEECSIQRRPRDEAAVKAALLADAQAEILENWPDGAELVDKWADYSMIDAGHMRLKLTCELRVDIAATGR